MYAKREKITNGSAAFRYYTVAKKAPLFHLFSYK